MDCLGCNLLEISPVSLRTGIVVCSSCEAWRHECEARDTMKLTRNEITRYFELVEKARGLNARHELRREMIALRKMQIVL